MQTDCTNFEKLVQPKTQGCSLSVEPSRDQRMTDIWLTRGLNLHQSKGVRNNEDDKDNNHNHKDNRMVTFIEM